MFGGNAAAVALQRREQTLAHVPAFFGEGRRLHLFWFEDVDVEIAVADMPVPQHLEIGILPPQQPVDFLKQRRHARNSHRDVVFVRLVLADRFADVLAQPPKLLGLLLALADRAINQPALFGALFEQRQRRVRVKPLRILEFGEDVVGRFGIERPLQAFFQHVPQRQLREKLEGAQIQLAAQRAVNGHDAV